MDALLFRIRKSLTIFQSSIVQSFLVFQARGRPEVFHVLKLSAVMFVLVFVFEAISHQVSPYQWYVRPDTV